MARTINRLKPKDVTSITKEGLHADGGGLYLRLQDGKRYWLFRYERDNREHRYGIGPAAHQAFSQPGEPIKWVIDISLAQARETARDLRMKLRAGIDPVAEKRDRERAETLGVDKRLTLDECIDRYVEAHGETWTSAKYKRQWSSQLRANMPVDLLATPAFKIDSSMIYEALKTIWIDKTPTAKNLRQRLELVLDWAKAFGARTGENPAAWKGNLAHLLAKPSKLHKVTHHKAMPYVEVPAFMGQLREIEKTHARALEFLILTAARTDEVIGAKWSEIDLEAKIWTVPAERMKGRREHKVPLTPSVIALLERAKQFQEDDRLFAISRIDDFLGTLRDDVTIHGFRSSFRTWVAEQTQFPGDLAEASLAHIVGDEVERAYRRTEWLDKRRRLMGAWTVYCTSPVHGANVTPLRQEVRK